MLPCNSISHLSDGERDQIAILRAAGRSMAAIARTLGRAKTTITRELQRNALPSGGYSPLHAAGAYQLRRRRESDPPTRSRFTPVRAGSARRGLNTCRTDLRLVEMWQRTATAGHRLRDNLRLHLSNRTGRGRGFMALFDASPQTPSPASRQSLARRHQGSSVNP